MARFSVSLETGGRPLKGASVEVFDEKVNVAVGDEDSNFSESDRATIYSDPKMETEASQPLTTDDLGEATFYMPSGSQVAIKVSRAQYGTRWFRFVDITGADI